MKWDSFIRWGAAIVGAVVGTVQDSWSGVLTFLLILNIMDYVTGVVCAMVGKSSKTVGGSLSSAVGFAGIAKKFFIWAIIILATCVDRFVIGNGTTVQSAAAMFYAANEALSVIENCALIGLPVPAFLRTMLEVMRDKSNSGGKDGTSG